jgi:uncharacterized membrane protein HdeD (DUF308 family)
VVSLALVVVTGVLLVLTAIAGYARFALISSEGFANRATATLDDPSVRDLLAERVTDRLVLSNRSELLAARPLIISAVSGIVGGGAFGGLFHKAALDVHRAVFDRDQNTITLTLVDVGTVAGEALEEVRPQLAAEIQEAGRVDVISERVSGVTGDLARVGHQVRVLAWLLLGLLLAAAAGAVAASQDRRRTVSQLGLAAIAAGVLVIVAYLVGRVVVLASFSDPQERAAAAAVWKGFLGDLRSLGLLIAGAGAIMTAAARSLIDPELLERPVERLQRLAAREPRSVPLRLLRAVGLVALGVLVVVEPGTAVQVVAVLAGVFLVHEGVQAILRLVYRPPRRRHAAEPEPEEERTEPGRRRKLAVGAVAVGAVALIATVFLAAGGIDQPRAAAVATCNGSRALCDRPFDEVVLPATHNSMSAPLPGWFSAEQERSIAGQLEDGIRGLLFDTHYGDRLENGRVRTAFQSSDQLRQAIQQDGASEQSVQAALRLRERLGFRGEGERGMYLCHTFCELGSTPLAEVLDDIHTFLVTHPGEVLAIVNQDYLTPQDFVGAMEEAGLARLAFTPPADGDWPTLREMIDADTRLVVLAENRAGAAPWYQLAYERLVEETPFMFRSASLLTDPARIPASCAPNRGPERAPLFLINHWVSTDPAPQVRDARRVNAYEPLMRRARECERIRDHLPNLLAVNFYKEGDVFRVADALNTTD